MTKRISPGAFMMQLAKELWPLNRSITGVGVRATLACLKKQIPALEIHSVKSGEQVFDWQVPLEWHVNEAFIICPSGKRICDFMSNNLHLVGYSIPFEGSLSLEELQGHLYSLPSQPDAIPYVTSYYKEIWGFCISQRDRDALEPGIYQIVIRSSLFRGELNYGELVIPGKSNREIFFSTYICHPSMANNELSGPILAISLAKKLSNRQHHYTYRFIFIPETIGALIYLSRNLDILKLRMLAGYVLTCVGDERGYSFLPSRIGNTVADRTALEVLKKEQIEFKYYSWQDRGSDERQYCSPGADLPVCSVMRSKYGTFPEYHTSLDTLGQVVTEKGLQGSFDIYSKIIDRLESQRFPKVRQIGEPNLGKRGLWPTTSKKGVYGEYKPLLDALSIMDGKLDINEISDTLNIELKQLLQIIVKLEKEGLIEQ